MGLKWKAALTKEKTPRTPITPCCCVINQHKQYTQLFPQNHPKKVLENVAIEKLKKKKKEKKCKKREQESSPKVS